MNYRRIYTLLSVWLVALVAAAIALLVFESDLLWMIQEKNLFLHSQVFFQEKMLVSGGLLVWIGTYLTQFFYYPWLGVTILAGWWLLLMWLTKRTFRLPDHGAIVTLIPVALLLLAIVDLGYWVYMLKQSGYAFVPTVGTTMVVAALWGFRALTARLGRTRKYYALCIISYALLICAVGYVVAGVYGLAATLLMGLWSWRLGLGRGNALVCSVVALLSVVAIPLLMYRYVYYQTNVANIYVTGLPLYYVTEEYTVYYLPFILLAVFFVVLCLRKVESGQWRVDSSWTSQAAKPSGDYSKRTMLYTLAVVAVVVICVGLFWFKDENFHRELAMQRSIARQDWQGVLEEAKQQKDEPTRAIVMMRNLALSRLGRQGDEMFLYRNGSKRYEAPFGMRLMLVVGPLVYYEYGMLNYCNRLCTEMSVEFNWSPEHLKLMTKCAALSGEGGLARKYNELLKQTTFFGSWAKHAEPWLESRERAAGDPELAPVAHMMHYDELLGSDQGFVERFLMQNLAKSTYIGDPVFQEQALLATFWTHDIQQFWRRFTDYIRVHRNARMPRYYQEAAWLYGQIQGRKDLDRLPFDNYVKEGFNRFVQFAEQYNDADVEVAREALYPYFGETYYYDYYTMSNLPEY
jgi:hypothetical protein